MTKLISIALAALVATVGVASAASDGTAAQGRLFANGLGDRDHGEARLEFSRVDAPAIGVIEVYEYRFGETGRLLATEAVNAGTNWRVSVPVGSRRHTDMLAVLKVGGQVVDQRFVGDID